MNLWNELAWTSAIGLIVFASIGWGVAAVTALVLLIVSIIELTRRGEDMH